jgi:hypothetical protein
MSSENTFYVYRIVNSEGELKHSSILYDDGAGASRSPDEIRQSLLTAAEYAMGEYELEGYDADPDPDVSIELLGPFVLGGPIDSLTHAELTQVPEEERP